MSPPATLMQIVPEYRNKESDNKKIIYVNNMQYLLIIAE